MATPLIVSNVIIVPSFVFAIKLIKSRAGLKGIHMSDGGFRAVCSISRVKGLLITIEGGMGGRS